MKALAILQPYAWLIVTGHKDVENRTWVTNHRGRLLIHAGSKMHPGPIAEIERRAGFPIPLDALQFGGIIGRVDLVDVVTHSPSRWFDGPYGFVLRNPRSVSFFPVRGVPGLFDVPIRR